MPPAGTKEAAAQTGATSIVLIRHDQAATDGQLTAAETAAAPVAWVVAVAWVVEAAACAVVVAVEGEAAEGAEPRVILQEPTVRAPSSYATFPPSQTGMTAVLKCLYYLTIFQMSEWRHTFMKNTKHD